MSGRRSGGYIYKTSVGQDSHAFEDLPGKPLILGGVDLTSSGLSDMPGLSANSDGDVILHALTNAVSGITCRNILGKIADEMCKKGIKDSSEYLKAALSDLNAQGYSICHVSLSLECSRPRISPYAEDIRSSLAEKLDISPDCVGLTATSGEGLTAFGKGLGIAVICILTVKKKA